MVSSPRVELPTPPAHLAGGIGSGDFWQTGNAIIGLTMAFAAVHPDDRVLDVGCGLGRVAWPVARLLDRRGMYDGFDASAEYIQWCQTALPLDPARFHFHRFDINSSLYNPAGAIKAEHFAFPWPDGSFTLTIAASIFTHLPPVATSNYLREIARTLERGGRLFSSFFVLDDESLQLIRTRVTDPAFTTTFDEGMYADPSTPEAAVAFDSQWLARTLDSAGLAFDSFYPGRWRQSPGAFYQDIVIAQRK